MNHGGHRFPLPRTTAMMHSMTHACYIFGGLLLVLPPTVGAEGSKATPGDPETGGRSRGGKSVFYFILAPLFPEFRLDQGG